MATRVKDNQNDGQENRGDWHMEMMAACEGTNRGIDLGVVGVSRVGEEMSARKIKIDENIDVVVVACVRSYTRVLTGVGTRMATNLVKYAKEPR